MTEVYTRLDRTNDAEGDHEVEVTVFFSSSLLVKGQPSRGFGDPGGFMPGISNEWDHRFEGATADLYPGDPPLDPEEIRKVMAWFESAEGQKAANEAANDEERMP